MLNYLINIGDEVTCPVCHKTFNLRIENRYIISGGYTCDWNCFIDEVKRRDMERTENGDKKKKRTI